MAHSLYWCSQKISFEPEETLAFALARVCKDEEGFGKSPAGQTYGLFCGMGTCQGCLVKIKGRGKVEACLTICRDGMEVEAIHDSNRDGPRAARVKNGG